ncbi:MAG: DUF6057 family protein, partial [Sedimentisphaerales bacterium]
MRVTNAPRKIMARCWWGLLPDAAFFVFFYLYLAFAVDLRLLYHGGGLIDNFPVFYRGWDFLKEFLAYPGGSVEYLSALLAQSFYYSWLGSAIVTVQALTICLCTDYVARKVGAPRLRGLRFLGPLVLLALYCQYAFHFPTTMGLSLSLVSFCFYLRFTPRKATLAALFFLALTPILYVAAGGPALVFVVLCGLYEVLLRIRRVLGLLMLVSGAAMPVLGSMVYGARLLDAYSRLLPFSWRLLSRQSGRTMLTAVYLLYLFLPLTVAAVGIWHSFFMNTSSKARSEKRRSKGRQKLHFIVSKVFYKLQTPALVAITIATLLISRNPELRRSLQVDYYSRYRMWDKVIEIGRWTPYHYFVCHALDRALYQTGRLGDEMFCFPQKTA